VIVGSVSDPSGAAVANARIELINEQTGLKREASSDTTGAFRVPDLPTGLYVLSVKVQGFKKYEQGGIVLTVNRNVTVNPVLQMGGVSERMTVTTAPSQVDTVSGAISSVVGSREAKELPLNGRNILQLMALNPGLAPTDTYHEVTGNTSYAVNGARGDQVNFLLDGATNNDNSSNNSNYFPNPDAVQEFSVLTNNFSAEYGMGAGGIVNAVTKSGTNRLHASAFEFVRNNQLNAADFFSHQTDTLKRNQYGGAIGGPVYIPHLYNGRDRTFFFYSYQDTALRSAPSTKTAFVPTAAERGGDFSQSALPQSIDPLTGQPFVYQGRVNVIDPVRFDPVVVKMLNALVPLPNAGRNLLRFGAKTQQDDYEHLAKIDYSISSKNKLMGRFFLLNSDKPPVRPTPTLTGVNILAAANGTINRSVNVVLSDSHIFSPALLNNLTLNFNRLNNTSLAAYPDKNYCDFGRKMFCFPSGLRFTTPQFAFPGETTTLAPNESFRLADGVNWIRGRHNLKLGLDLRSVRSDYHGDSTINGIPSFTGQLTGNAFADMLLGFVARQNRFYYTAVNLRGFFQSYYLQNDIRLSKRLSLNLGIRWDPYSPWVEKSDKLTHFDLADNRAGVHSQRFPNAPPGSSTSAMPVFLAAPFRAITEPSLHASALPTTRSATQKPPSAAATAPSSISRWSLCFSSGKRTMRRTISPCGFTGYPSPIHITVGPIRLLR
jgi:outer membrane receptor protein involved in Fe transport